MGELWSVNTLIPEEEDDNSPQWETGRCACADPPEVGSLHHTPGARLRSHCKQTSVGSSGKTFGHKMSCHIIHTLKQDILALKKTIVQIKLYSVGKKCQGILDRSGFILFLSIFRDCLTPLIHQVFVCGLTHWNFSTHVNQFKLYPSIEKLHLTVLRWLPTWTALEQGSVLGPLLLKNFFF